MDVFGKYARYYDLLYREKNYSSEAEYVHRLVQRHAPGAKSVVELGCGTGAHAEHLARLGYSIHGVDRSREMLERAASRLAGLPAEQASRLAFSSGDIRTIRLGTKADAVIALFHVLSYQLENDDLMAVFATARHHLNPAGIFIFDCWYGPAVLAEKPSRRTKRLEDDTIDMTRTAEPAMRSNENIVDVHYQLVIKEKIGGKMEELREIHSMRYLFVPEIETLMTKNGMTLVAREEWMTGKAPGPDTWGACFVGKAV